MMAACDYRDRVLNFSFEIKPYRIRHKNLYVYRCYIIKDSNESLANTDRFIAIISIGAAVNDAHYVGGNFGKSRLPQHGARSNASGSKNSLWN